ncbi:N-formylglutamate amidohydrolase [Humitalea sp. 24SJ18S-53]|uniref:N-formylglutamate amidohydrolase n=1 Tax=Humitalea sp. 24SJ18S-53 TaxID=3422307 RepID=UPI003D675328
MDLPHHPDHPAPPCVLTRPKRQVAPIVFASAHSGRDYPPLFLAESRLDAISLRRSEDSFVEQLFAQAPALGMPLLAATFPRVYCDANREPWELDPGMFDGPLPAWVNSQSPRVGAGLGTLARVAASGEAVYSRRIPFAEAEARVRNCWEPYHAALSGLIAETVAAFGCCLLIDCHSMPAHPAHGQDPPDMVLGDAHGTACAPRATRLVEEGLQGLGYRVRRNDPYAGGYVTRHYGRPRDNVHAVQIEIARSLYMDEAAIRPHAGLEVLAARLTGLMTELAGRDWSWLRR